jgi:hypothetical protein
LDGTAVEGLRMVVPWKYSKTIVTRNKFIALGYILRGQNRFENLSLAATQKELTARTVAVAKFV